MLFFAALILAVIIVIVDYFEIPVLKQIFSLYVSFFRGTPLVSQMFMLYFGLPIYIHSMRAWPANFTCLLAMTLNAGAYMRESLRGALLSVPKGQEEAALAHGMSKFNTFRKILLPQTMRIAIPTLLNTFIDIIKGSSIAFTIGVVEITAVANLRASHTLKYFECYLVLMLMYWIVVLILEKIFKRIEKKLSVAYIV